MLNYLFIWIIGKKACMEDKTEKRKQGRPKIFEGSTEKVSGYIPEKNARRFKMLAAMLGKSNVELLNEAVELLLSQHQNSLPPESPNNPE